MQCWNIITEYTYGLSIIRLNVITIEERFADICACEQQQQQQQQQQFIELYTRCRCMQNYNC